MKTLWKIWGPALLLVSVAGWGQAAPQTPPQASPPAQTPAQTPTTAPNQPSAPAADPVVGDWKGNLTSDLPIVVHITLSKGAYVATTDSPNQGAADIPTTVITDGNTIRFRTVAATPSSFTGTINGNTITGTFTEGGTSVPLTLTRVAPDDATLVGDWQSTGSNVQVILHIADSPKGYTATVDSPKQGLSGIRSTVIVTGDSVRLQITSTPPATFVGVQTGSTLLGTFTQGRNSTAITFTRSAAAALAATSTAATVVGDWQGAITPLIPIIVHIRATGNGYTATTDSPTLGKTNVRAQITVNGNSVRLQLAGSPQTIFTGIAGGNALTGTLTTGRNSAQFTLARVVK